jgi:DNA-binding CsgD family transcriptional regulator
MSISAMSETQAKDATDSAASCGDPSGTLFDSSGICMARLDSELRLAAANADFLSLFGRTAGEVYNRVFCEFLHPSMMWHLQRQLSSLLNGWRIRLREHIVVLRPSGSTFSGVLTGIASGRPNEIVVLVHPEKTTEGRPVIKRDKLLTEMDARILEGVAAGRSSVKLASLHYLSRQGVEYHVGVMLRKFKVSSRPALVSRAYSLGILSVGNWPPQVLPEFIK